MASKAVFDTLYSASVVKEVSGSYEVSTHVLEEGEGEGEGEEGSREREGREGRGKGRGRRAVGRGRGGRGGRGASEGRREGRGGEESVCTYTVWHDKLHLFQWHTKSHNVCVSGPYKTQWFHKAAWAILVRNSLHIQFLAPHDLNLLCTC